MPRPKGSKNRRPGAFRPAKAPEARPAPARPVQAAPGALAGPPAPRPPTVPVPAATGATAAAAAAILGTSGGGALPPPAAPPGAGAPTAPPSPPPPAPPAPAPSPAEAAALSAKERTFLSATAVRLLDSLLQSFDPAATAAPGPPPTWGLSDQEKKDGQERIADVLAEVGPGVVMDFANKHGAKIMLALWALGIAWPRVNLWRLSRSRPLGSGTPGDLRESPKPAALVPPEPAGPSDVERRLAGG